MKKDRWVKRWRVQGSNDKTWTVAIDKDGKYGCSCPRWKFHREECHHITAIKMGLGSEVTPQQRPEYVLATVMKPTYDKDTNRLFIPLIGVPDAMMMQATICFYMLRYGFPMSEIRRIRRIPGQWTAKAIIAHVEQHGEAEYPEGWYTH